MFASFFYSIRHMFDYAGRARQAEYISFCLVVLFYKFILFLALGASLSDFILMKGGPILVMVLEGLLLLAYLALVVRRLHDFNLSGWWVLLLLLPLPLTFLPFIGEAIDLGFWLWAIWISAWAFFFFYKGVEGPNIYGPDPLAGAVSSGHEHQ